MPTTSLPAVSIRPLTREDQPFLWRMLYQALYVPQGADPPPPETLQRPELRRYVQEWGQPEDMGFVATDEVLKRSVGAAWIRLLAGENRGYGHIDDSTPELSIAVLPAHRGRGVGTLLLTHLMIAAGLKHRSVSLSVQADNPARHLYDRLGFAPISVSGGSLTMVKVFPAGDA